MDVKLFYYILVYDIEKMLYLFCKEIPLLRRQQSLLRAN